MGHYKSNLRDLEFNLFEVLGRQDGPRHRPVRARWTPTPRAAMLRRGRRGWPSDELADVLRRRRPQPAGLRPGRPAR